MSNNSDGYKEAGELTKVLQKQYEAVRAELKTVAANTAREEVERIAADNEGALQKLIGEAVAKQRGGGAGLQAKHIFGLVAAVLFVWLASSFVATAFPGLAFWRSGTQAEVGGKDKDRSPEELDENLPVIARGPLHQVATERYDSLFARRDPAFQRLIERVGTQGAATLDSTVAQALARWTADSVTVTEADRAMVHAAAFQAALRELTGGEYKSPVNGKVDRVRCDRDEYCQKLVQRWRIDRTTGMRLLPQIPDRGAPAPALLVNVEKVVIYSLLPQ